MLRRKLRHLLSFDAGSLLILSLTACAIAVLWIFVALSVARMQAADGDKARVEALHTVDALAGDIGLTIEVAIASLNRALDAHARSDRTEIFARILADLAPTHPEIATVALIDPTGHGEVVTRDGVHALDAREGESFRALSERDTTDVHIALPFGGRARGVPQIAVARRLDDASGRFAGIAAITLNFSYVEKQINNARIGQRGTVAIHRIDRRLFAASANLAVPVGQSTSDSELWTHYSHLEYGQFDAGPSAIDGIARNVSYTRISNLPLVAVATLAEPDLAERAAEIAATPHVAATLASLALTVLGTAGILQAQRTSRLRRIAELRRRAADAARFRATMANAAKSRFLANMSHELRTPLNAVLGFAETIRGGYLEPVGPRTRECADNIAESGERLLLIVDELLDATDLEADGSPLQTEDVVLREIVERAIARLSFEIAQRRIAVEIAGPVDRPARLNARALRRALTSLVANAVRFSPADGQVRVEIALPAGGLEIRVADNGPGLPPEIAARVGEPFLQNDSPLTAGKSGAGVGLWVVKSLVERQGGRLRAEATPGGGATFVLHFPGARTATAGNAA
jgi:signal transduction histidine kinase